MKITYAFADGTTSVVEVDDEIGAYIMDSRRQENNDDRRHRYHNYSLDDVTYEGSLIERYDKAQERINTLKRKRAERRVKADAIGNMMFRLRELDQPLEYFDERLWLEVIDSVLVHPDGLLTFKLYDGTEVSV